jgi:hypothetical protein
MMEHFIPEECDSNDSAHHKSIRQLAAEPLDTPEEEFTKEEILAALAKFDPMKAPGEDGWNMDILMKIFRKFPLFFTEIYECVRKGYFSNQRKHSSIIPIVKPGKEESTELTKYRPISLASIGGKVLEKLLIDRINH